MTELHDSIRLDNESDEYQAVSVVAVAPTWRDVWAILRGRYKPRVYKRYAITTAGAARVMKQVYNRDSLSALHDSNPLLERLTK